MTKPRVQPLPNARSDREVGRRSVLQGLLAGVGAGVAVPGFAATHPLAEHAQHPQRIADAQGKAAQSEGAPELLDAYQMQMLESLAERIVPGAGAAGCARFIDSLLAVGERDDARELVTALGAIDAEARNRFEMPWLALDREQQTALLEAASAGTPGRPDPAPWEPGTPVAAYLASAEAEPDPPPRVTLRDRFDILKGWVVGAYYSSEPGLWDLGYTGLSFGATFRACTHPDGHREG